MRRLSAEMMALLMTGVETNLHPLKPSVRTFDDGVTRHRNLTYYQGHPRDAVRRKLDLYIPPTGARIPTRPIVIFAHGGGWCIGSKDDLMGLYGRIARKFARHGIAFASINYRLTPRVTHPGHVEDVASAVAWLHANAGAFGYSNQHVFLAGHSAGAHLMSLLALNGRFLSEHDIDPRDVIRGVIAMSGLYDLRDIDDFLPHELASVSHMYGSRQDALMRANRAFPPETVLDASPITNVTYDAPPFLLIHEEYGEFMKHETVMFAEALERAGVKHDVIEMPGTNHISMLVELLRDEDETRTAIEQFVCA